MPVCVINKLRLERRVGSKRTRCGREAGISNSFRACMTARGPTELFDVGSVYPHSPCSFFNAKRGQITSLCLLARQNFY